MNVKVKVEGEVIEGEVIDETIVDDSTSKTDESEVKKEKPEPKADEELGEGELSNEDEVIVTIGDEEPTPDDEEEVAPGWVRELRKTNREVARENRELKAKLETKEQTEAKPVALGEKPKLDDPDIDYDTELYEQRLDTWNKRKRLIEAETEQAETVKKEEQKVWQTTLDGHEEKKSKLKVKDYDDAEEAVFAAFSQVQQGIVVQGADNSALVFYAIGKNPEQLKKLTAIEDPVKFSFAVAKLEKDLRVKNRKAPPPPEKHVSGTGSSAGAVDSTLERLRAEAVKTGDYTKVTRYKQKKREATT